MAYTKEVRIMTYTIIIKCKDEADYTIENISAAIRLGLMAIKAECDDNTQSVIFRNLDQKKANKMISKIKRIKYLENIANYRVIKNA
jgi:hypothetical protein